MSKLLSRLAGCLLLLTGGCYVDGYADYPGHYDDAPPPVSPPPPRYAEGVLRVEWSIAGVFDPYECQFSATYGAAIIIETPSGGFVDEYTEDCEAFEANVTLRPGTYVATVVLLDEDGYERTTAVSVPVTIYSGYQTDLPVDFPPDSFY